MPRNNLPPDSNSDDQPDNDPPGWAVIEGVDPSTTDTGDGAWQF